MSTLLIYNFDGTGNEPDDADQEFNQNGVEDDENISNILKFHLLCGGSLKQNGDGWSRGIDPQQNGAQRCFYYQGVGTYGSWLQRNLNAGVAPDNLDVRTIMNSASKDLTDNYNAESDQDVAILITGFSRGAALARRFAAKLQVNSSTNVFLAVFDTVASFGMADLNKEDRPKSKVLFENCTLATHITQALHLVSLDDKRKAFQPTLMNQEAKVKEVWFTGAHSDVGGGYRRDGLSDLTLRFMMNWVDNLNIGVEMKTANEIDYENIQLPKASYNISREDILIHPNPFGRNHQQDRSWLISKFTLSDRRCVVIKEDKITDDIPIIHWSVARRIYKDDDYRPASMRGISHFIIYPDGATKQYSGFGAHEEYAFWNWKDVTEIPIEATVFGSEKHNHTGLLLEEGVTYQFDVEESQQWLDGSVRCGPDGWDTDDPDVRLGWVSEFTIDTQKRLRRAPKQDWFCLMGAVGTDDKHVFKIGEGPVTWQATTSGEFCPFANDMNKRYGNNSGNIKVKVSKVN